MSPKNVKDFATTCDCAGCKAITKEDYYIGLKAPVGTPKMIRTIYNDKRCQSKKCGKLIAVGTEVFWLRGKGAWHVDCYKGNE